MADQTPRSIWDDPQAPIGPAPPRPGEIGTVAPAAPSIWSDGPDPLETSLKAARIQKPDAAAHVLQLQMKTGLPPAVIERNLEDVESKAAATDFNAATFRASYPGLATWLQEPANAAIAHDDLEKLSTLSQILERPKNALLRLVAAQNVGASGVFGMLEAMTHASGTTALGVESILGSESTSERSERGAQEAFFKKMRQETLKTADYVRGDESGAGRLERGIYSGIESVGLMAPGILASLATGSPGPMLAILGVQTGGASYGQAIDAGASYGRAVGYGAIDATIEVATEFLPAKWFLGDVLGNKGLRAIVLNQLAGEVPGELVATTLQSLNEHFALHPDKPFSDYTDALPGALVDTVIATVTSVALMGAVGKVASSLAGDGGRAKQAELDKDFFTALASGVKGSATVERMAPAAQALFTQLTQDGPIEHIYVPVEAFATYFQDKALDTPQGKIEGASAIAAALTGHADSLERAQQTGENLEIPTAVYAAQLAGSEHHTALVDDLRLGSPFRMNARESAAYREEQAKVAAEPPSETPATVSPVRQMVLQKLQAGLAGSKVKLPRQALERYADMFEALIPTLAGRENLDPVDVLRRYGLIVEAPREAASAAVAPLSPGVQAVREGMAADHVAAAAAARGTPGDVPDNEAAQALERERTARPDTNVPTEDDASYNEWAANASKVAENPQAASAKDLRRAAGYLGQRRALMQARATKEGTTPDPNVWAGLNNEIDWYVRLANEADANPNNLDRNTPNAQTTEEPDDASSEQGPNRLVDQAGSPARNRVSASDPGTGKKADARYDKHVARLFDAVLANAQALDPAVDPLVLRAEFKFRFEFYRDRQTVAAESGLQPHSILRAIAAYGGISLDEKAERASEFRQMFGGTMPAFGAVAGVRGVFRTKSRGGSANKKAAGWSADVMLQTLQADPEFAWIESIDALLDQIDEAQRHGVDTMSRTELPGTEELRDVGVLGEKQWWVKGWAPEAEPDENPDTSDVPDDADTDFAFNQDPIPTARYLGEQDDGLGGTMSLYNVIGGEHDRSTVTAERLTELGIDVPPIIDVLDTGEAQPRLFGDASQTHSAPLGEVPFALTSEFARTNTKTLQRTLFQDPIESTHVVAPKFYSRILRTVELSTQLKGTGKQWAGIIRNSKLGVNLDEFALTGVEDLEADKVYSKTDVLSYLAVHQVQVSEVIFGEPITPEAQQIWRDKVNDRAEKIYNRWIEEGEDALERHGGVEYERVDVAVQEMEDGMWGVLLDEQDEGDYYDTEEDAQAAADALEMRENDRHQADAEEEARRDITNRFSFDDAVDEAELELDTNKDEDDADDKVKFDDARYRLDPTPGFDKASYREAFVTAPDQDATAWQDGHEEYSNVSNPIVRLRFATRVGTLAGPDTGSVNEGAGTARKLLFIEEMQPPGPDNQKAMPALYLKNWREIGFKWALRYAAEHGYGGIAWTTGEQQRERYSLRKEVDAITWEDAREKAHDERTRKRVSIAVKGGGTIELGIDDDGVVLWSPKHAAQFNEKTLASVIGKELAANVLADDVGEIKEEGLEIGGLGLKRLYDVDFPAVVNKLPAVKASGGRVTAFDIGLPRPDYNVVRQVSPGEGAASEVRWFVEGAGNNYRYKQEFATQEEARAHIVERGSSPPLTQPGLELTPAMKASVLGGQTLFQDPKPSLIIQHNVTAANLRHAAKIGGIPVPSLAIAKADDSLIDFGEITLIGHKEMADPRGYAKPKVFGSDVYSPRYPTIHYKIDRAGEKTLAAALEPFSEITGRTYYDLDSLQKEGARYLERDEPRVKAAFLESRGLLDRDALAKEKAKEKDAYYGRVNVENWLRKTIEKHSLDRELETFAADLFATINPAEQIFRGFTNAGNRRYQAHTLENIVTILKKNIRGGESESNVYGVGQLRSKFTTQFKSVKGITDAKDRIVSDAAFEAIKKETEEELFDITKELGAYYQHDAERFGFVDTVMAVMEDGATKGLSFALKDYGFIDVPDETKQRIAGFMHKLRTMPTEYFEAKILREVDLAEFAGAVVPADIAPDILELLKARGLQVATYDRREVRKDVVNEFAKQLGDKVLFQDPPAPPEAPKRGSITGPFDRNAFFGPDLQFTIKLFESADVSTFLHESAHLFLKIMQDLEARPEASAGLKRDLAIIRERFGLDGVEQQESFARAFEAYLLEGKAPSLALRTVFDGFRSWLLRLYKTMTGLNVNLTDDVRGVFDRMLASDAAIAEAEAAVAATPMFTTAASARMSPSEFDLYRQKIAEASRKGRKDLEEKLLKDLQRQQTIAYREEKDVIRDQVQADVYAMPVYQALAAMRKGTHPDGSPLVEGVPLLPLKLSKQAILDQFGAERLAALPKPAIYTVEDGMAPDAVAPLFGFSSGDELLKAVTAAAPMRGLIAAETTKRAQAQLGDLVLDDRLSDLARAAVANEHRAAIVAIELETLSRLRRTAQAGAVKERDYERRWFEAEAKLRIAIAEGRTQAAADAEIQDVTEAGKAKLAEVRATKNAAIAELTADVRDLKKLARGGPSMINAAIPSEADIRVIAQERIGRTRIRDLRPETFFTAARQAGQAALEAAARQDFAAAIAAKQQEQIALALYREAATAKEAAEARVKQAQALDSPASRRRMGLAGKGYQEQIDAILDRYDFAKITGKALDKREALRLWISQLEADGFSVDLPDDLIDDARRIHYRELTVDELAAVTDGLTGIVRLASLKLRLLKNRDQRAYVVVRNGLVESIRAHSPLAPTPLEFRPKDDRHRSISEWFASHARIATLGQVMDGKQEGGAFWSAINRPINEAVSEKERRNAVEGHAYAAILEQHYPGRAMGRMGELMQIDAIKGSLSKEARLSVALNWGNQTSRDRMTSDPKRKWNEKQIKAILDTLDANDLAFVQATFDFLERFWPEIAAKSERLTGVAPEKVLPLPITTKAGTIAGGYYPLAYDSRLNLKGQQQEEAQSAKLKVSAAYVQSTTKRGHLETRKKNVQRSARLEIGVMFAHLEQVIHDLTHHEMLIDVTRLLRDPLVQDAILDTKGDLVYQQFTRAIESIAAGKIEPAKTGVEKAATWMRTGSQISILGWNLWTGAQQPLGLFNGAQRVGPRWVARGLKRWLVDAATMQNTTTWINDVSPFMASRSVNATQDLSDLRAAFRASGGWFDTAVRTVTRDVVTQQQIIDGFLWHIGLMQRVADVPTWLGQFEKSMAGGETEARASALADQAVIDSQGSGRISDLSQVQRGGPLTRLYLTFYSYGATTYNATYLAAGRTDFKSPAQVATFLGHLSLIYVMPAMATVALRGLVRGGGDDDDDWTGYLEDVGRESVSSALNTMMWVRELSQIASEGTRGYAGPAGARAVQLIYQLGGQAKQGQLDEALLRAALATGGILFRFPAAQAQRTIDGWVALEEGRTENPLALLFGPPRTP